MSILFVFILMVKASICWCSLLNIILTSEDVHADYLLVTLSLVQLAPDQGMQPADQPSELRRRCEEEAQDMVRLSNALPEGEQRVQSPGLTQLISRLTALLLQIRVRH